MKKLLMVLAVLVLATAVFALNPSVYVYGSGQKIVSSVPFVLSGYSVVTSTAAVAGLQSFYSQNVTWTAMVGPYSLTSTSAVGNAIFGFGQYGLTSKQSGILFSKGMVVDFGTNTIGAVFY